MRRADWIVLGCGLPLVACCGIAMWVAVVRWTVPTPKAVPDSPDAMAFLEVLPASRTGLTREQAKWMLDEGTAEHWRKLWPEGRLAICRLAAKRLHPHDDEDKQYFYARHYFNTVEEVAWTMPADKSPISDTIAVWEALYQAAPR